MPPPLPTWAAPELPTLTSFAGKYLGGDPEASDAAGNAALKLSEEGILITVSIPAKVVYTTVVEAAHNKTIVGVPWREIRAMHAEGPDAIRQRVTATRVAIVGVFALAIPKDVKSDCCVVVEGAFGELYFAVKRKTVHELRAELAPWLVRVSADLAASQSSDGRHDGQDGTLLEAVKELIALRQQGELTEDEFLLAKADLFKGLREP